MVSTGRRGGVVWIATWRESVWERERLGRFQKRENLSCSLKHSSDVTRLKFRIISPTVSVSPSKNNLLCNLLQVGAGIGVR